METKRLSDNYSALELNQMREIDKLQERIKLMSFDKTNDSLKISELKAKIKRKRNNINYIIEELETMVKDKVDYIKLYEIIHMLKSIRRDLEWLILY